MKLIEINWNPSDRELRQFGLTALVAVPLAGWLWSGPDAGVFWTTVAVGAAAAMIGIAYPRGLKPGFLALSVATAPIGMLVSELILLAIFVTVFLPMGLVFRLLGRDPLQRGFDRQATTYWEPKKQPSSPASYLRQW